MTSRNSIRILRGDSEPHMQDNQLRDDLAGGRGGQSFKVVLPWLMSVVIGWLTALTGSYIALSCDFVGDLRFGFCSGIFGADRNHCCGGSENFDVLRETCMSPNFIDGEPSTVKWIPWEEAFGYESKVVSWSGYALSMSMYVGISILAAGTSAFLVIEYCLAAKGSGIPDVKAAVSGYDLPINFSGSCLIIKTLGLSLAVGAGLSLGKEGPLIHIGVCWAFLMQRMVMGAGLTTNDVMPLHTFACAGAAAGVSTAFGAPLGGVLFAVEELGSARVLGARTLLYSFMASTSASMGLKYLNLNGSNKLTMWVTSSSAFSANKEWIAWEMAAYLFVGVVCGLIGVVFVRLNLRWTKMRRLNAKNGRLWNVPSCIQDCILLLVPWVRKAASKDEQQMKFTPVALNVVEGMVIACATALMNYPIMELMRSLSVEAIHALFDACPAHRAKFFGLCDPQAEGKPNVEWSSCGLLLLAAVLRVFQTSFTFGAAIPSGLFIPSIFIGACVGRLIGNIFYIIVESGFLADNDLFDVHIEPGMFAMVGAIATLSGFCRMTVSLVVIMFELTAEITYLVPFMCAALAAKLVGDPLSPSIYDGHALLNNIAPIEEMPDMRLEMLVADLAVPFTEVNILDASEPVLMRTLREMAEDDDEDVPVLVIVPLVEGTHTGSVNDIIGVIDRKHLRKWLTRLAPDADVPLVLQKGKRSSIVCPDMPAPSMPRGSFRGYNRDVPAPSEAEIAQAAPGAQASASPLLGQESATLQSQQAGATKARFSYMFDDSLTPADVGKVSIGLDSNPEYGSAVLGEEEDDEEREPTSFWADPGGGGRKVPVAPPTEFLPTSGDDATELVDKRIVRISPTAPLLTAHCIFKEKPKLEFIVCYDKSWQNKYAVLSRSDFEASLSARCFPLAHPPIARPSARGGISPSAEDQGTEMVDLHR